ncbi:hypothetical protein FE810_13750 [Thalassotalea litorea]|uniref:Peptidyl-prolyl cis-trans isomerase n=1 Tax=Thalassotalea litorea TaxID=2020715 RepID=A0A5R9IE33_9GAMM|nr:hypothetical protein [Thalassotalea litorea]TLU61876.1 hypothetical protein FE810_13750 [Thalassotalea litorea]
MLFIDRLIKDPLWLFILCGAIIFSVHSYYKPTATYSVDVSDYTKNQLLEERVMLLGRPLQEQEEARTIQAFIDREILFLEALEQGVHRYDPRVRDVLVERMRLDMVSNINLPDEGELLDYYSSNLDIYKTESEISFDQFHFPEAPKSTTQILSLLAKEPELKHIGKVQRRSFDRYGKSVLRALYDKAQLAQLERAEQGKWFAMSVGDKGWFVTRVREWHAPSLIPYPDIRDQVRIDVTTALERESIEKFMLNLRKKYHVRNDTQG